MHHHYQLALFDMDETLLQGRTIHIIGEHKGFKDEVLRLEQSDIISYKKNKMIARLLKNMTQHELQDIFRTIPLQNHAQEVINTLHNHHITTAVVTNSYQFLADDLKQRLSMDYAIGNTLVVNNGIITGELIIHNTHQKPKFKGCKIHPICKRTVVDDFCQKLNIPADDIIAVGDGNIDICMLEQAGLGIAYKANPEVQQHADIATDDLRAILQYI